MSTHYPTRGGHSERGIAAGMFVLNFNIIDSAIGWGSSAALSLGYTLYLSWWSICIC